MDQSDDKPKLRTTQVTFITKANKTEKLQEDMMYFHSIDAEKELTALLTAAVKEEVKKEEKINPPSLEERIARMKKMLESTLPTVLQEAIHKNILSLMEKKIRRDHCE
jgi:hypothetical protein